MTSVFIPPACLSGPLAGSPPSWPLWAWDAYREWAGKHEAEGLSPSEASARAEADVRRWHDLHGEEWIKRGRRPLETRR